MSGVTKSSPVERIVQQVQAPLQRPLLSPLVTPHSPDEKGERCLRCGVTIPSEEPCP